MNQDTMSGRRALGRRAAGVMLGAAGLLSAGSALAQGQMRDGSDDIVEPEKGFLAESFDYVKHNSYFRVGVLHFQYYGTSSRLTVEDAQGLAAQAFPPGESEIPHTGSSAGNTTTLGGTIGIFLPKTGRHLAMEVTLAPPLKLDFELAKNAEDESLAPVTRNGIPTGVPPIGKSIGTFKALPPNFTIVYRPWVDTLIQPYIGAGAMYLYTYDTDVNNEVLNAYGNEPQLNLTKPVACVGQLGADFKLPQNMFITADVKYVGCATVEAKVNNIVINSPTLSPTVGPIDVGTVSSSNDFKAVLYQLSFGMRF
ncbi:OmpW family outer membrane protein [Salinisphaera sp. T31B1]|uniref:OmpW/AlkL family protein n=1 Tax=Salinisphaera sp. T31B1 TaxID=727963 RepID=UPI00333E6857